MIFFQPSERWLDWVVDYAAGRTVLDVGCGEGRVLFGLLKRRQKAVGIDAFPPEELTLRSEFISRVLPVMAEESRLVRDYPSLILMCRPCHGGFVWRVSLAAYSESEILYVSKPCNYHHDIAAYGLVGRRVSCPPCSEERAYTILRTRKHNTR